MPRSRPLIRLLAPAGTLALAVVLSAALAAPASAAAGPQPSLTITFKGKDRIYKAKKATGIKGKLRGYPGGNGARYLELRADPFPYGEYQVINIAITKANGRYTFKVAPDINTRYRVVDMAGVPAKSKARTLWVYARGSYDLRTASGVAVGKFQFRYSPDVVPNFLAGKRIHWYFRKATQSVARRVKTTRLKKRPTGGVRSSVRYRLPAAENGYSYYLTFCINKPPRDVGIGDKRPISCKARFRVGKAPMPPPAPDLLAPDAFDVPRADTRGRALAG